MTHANKKTIPKCNDIEREYASRCVMWESLNVTHEILLKCNDVPDWSERTIGLLRTSFHTENNCQSYEGIKNIILVHAPQLNITTYRTANIPFNLTNFTIQLPL